MIEKIKQIAIDKSNNNKIYLDRLKIEFKEIDKAGLWDYFAGLIESKRKFINENNLLCSYLWGLCEENPIDLNNDLIWEIQNEFPDLDIDFSPESRDHIKKYCIEKFGKEYVVSIANYNKFGIKSGIRDISRVYEIPLSEVVFTKFLDDEVNKIPWEESIEKYPDLFAFQEKYPQICELVREFNGRIRNVGKHAGGLVISSANLTETIPLITASDGDGGRIVLSSFSEGQNRSDLSTFGLVKQDILGLSNLDYISTCLEYMENRGKYNSKKGLFKLNENLEEWSDETYLNDKLSIEMAAKGDLLLVFQFDSSGMRQMIKRSKVSKFEDLVAATALYRPGPLNCIQKDQKIKIKNGFKSISKLNNFNDEIGYLNNNGIINYSKKFLLQKTGKKKILKIRTKSGKIIKVSPDHKFLKNGKFIEAKSLKEKDKIALYKEL